MHITDPTTQTQPTPHAPEAERLGALLRSAEELITGDQRELLGTDTWREAAEIDLQARLAHDAIDTLTESLG